MEKQQKCGFFFAHAYIMFKNWGGRVFFDVSCKTEDEQTNTLSAANGPFSLRRSGTAY